MKELRILVVDDSATNRRTLVDILSQVRGANVVGTAGDGDEALRLSATLAPDLITLDLEMPRMDGFTFLRLLMASRPTPVIVVSSHSAKENVFRALELGALDFIAKPEALLGTRGEGIIEQLERMIAMVRQLSPTQRGRVPSLPPERAAHIDAMRGGSDTPSTLVVIAASTGGPTALLDLFAHLPQLAQAAIVVAQHMPERFTKAFAERLDRISTFEVREAQGRTPLRARQALVCPGGKCVEIEADAGSWHARVVDPAISDRYAPSGDRLFRSAARAVGERVVGVVLTGMGDDGAQGVIDIKKAGGSVIVESEATAVIYGMPRCAEQTGVADAVLPLPELISRVAGFVARTEVIR